MKLQTEIPLTPEENQMDYSSKILLLGSCFSENIGAKFDYFKFQNIQNPFGVIFNVVSLEKLVMRAIENNLFSEEDIFHHNGIWKCFEVHSELNSLNKVEYLKNLNAALQKLRSAVLNSTHIIITLGTSYVYRYVGDSSFNIKTDSDTLAKHQIVANCHKLPQKNFKKELLSIEEITERIQKILNKISEVNPKTIVLFTVSPVRHIKDGFAENTLSKAHLISAIHQSLSSQIQSKSFYFPSFEIMMDELRDYRFYAEDMLHPNKTAINIIWQKFSKVWISLETQSLQAEIARIQSGLLHKPFNADSEEHLQFLEKLQQKISSVKEQFPHIHF
ncbi:GSCFA domain-containing protein [Aequorivita sediminis]|uniref:GSCFA domain-containing protein n=1 Tax=Aequorivita sediminis TaxID=3073653 RepID=UPI0028A9C774|nr:GSCFA domain-containing protein [Aequorivita sp. F6058]